MELVEALESEKRICATWRKTAKANSEKLENAQQRNAELDSFRAAYMEWSNKTDWVRDDRRFDVVKPLGKHLADVLKAYIEHLESRTITVKLPQRLQPGADGWDDWYVHSDDEGEYLKFDDVLAMLTAAGIKVEAE